MRQRRRPKDDDPHCTPRLWAVFGSAAPSCRDGGTRALAGTTPALRTPCDAGADER
jgi:hypothetical protein